MLARQLKENLVSKGKIRSSANVAILQINIENINNQIKAVSGRKNPNQNHNKYILDSVRADRYGRLPMTASDFNDESFYSRHIDTEVKLLENVRKIIIDNKLGSNIAGKITLHTIYELCGSCLGVIKQFSSLYPNVKVTVTWDLPASK